MITRKQFRKDYTSIPTCHVAHDLYIPAVTQGEVVCHRLPWSGDKRTTEKSVFIGKKTKIKNLKKGVGLTPTDVK